MAHPGLSWEGVKLQPPRLKVGVYNISGIISLSVDTSREISDNEEVLHAARRAKDRKASLGERMGLGSPFVVLQVVLAGW